MKWLVFSAVSGAVWGLAFGQDPWSVASWVALAPLVLVMGAPGGRGWTALLGWVHGLASWLAAIPWIAPTLETFGQLPPSLSYLGLFILSAYLAAFHAAFAVLGRPVWRRAVAGLATASEGAGRVRLSKVRLSSVVLALFSLPALWTALEWLRTHLFGGFPWNLAAYAWLETPGALATSAWIGAYGIGWLLLFANTAAALAVAAIAARRRSEPGTAGAAAWRSAAALAATGALVPLLVLSLGARFGTGDAPASRSLRHAPWAAFAGSPVRLLQPNIENQVEPDWPTIRANYAKVLRMSRAECVPGALVVWPESAAWPYNFGRDEDFRRDVTELARSGGCSVLFNSTHHLDGPDETYFNSAYLVSPAGKVSRYDKRKLVPFGEYVPFAGLFPWIDKLARNAGAFQPADELTLLPWRPAEGGTVVGSRHHGTEAENDEMGTEYLGGAICYEVVFPGQVADAVRDGATMLVTITNDAWYGDTAAPWQHYAAARFRAAESRRPLLRAAITGVSALVAPDGSERDRLDPFAEGVVRGSVEGRREISPYTRAPWLVPLLATLLALASVTISLRRRS